MSAIEEGSRNPLLDQEGLSTLMQEKNVNIIRAIKVAEHKRLISSRRPRSMAEENRLVAQGKRLYDTDREAFQAQAVKDAKAKGVETSFGMGLKE